MILFKKEQTNKIFICHIAIILMMILFISCSKSEAIISGTYLGQATVTTWDFEEVYDSIGVFQEFAISRDTVVIENYTIEIIENSNSNFFISEEIIINELDTLLFEYEEDHSYKYLDEFDGINSKRVCFSIENEMLAYEFQKNKQYSSAPNQGKSITYTGKQN